MLSGMERRSSTLKGKQVQILYEPVTVSRECLSDIMSLGNREGRTDMRICKPGNLPADWYGNRNVPGHEELTVLQIRSQGVLMPKSAKGLFSYGPYGYSPFRMVYQLHKRRICMKNKLFRTMMLGLTMSAMVSMGCVSSFAEETEEAVEEAVEETEETEEETDVEEEEEEDTGIAPEEPGVVYEPGVDAENPKDQAILVVSFGTSFNQNRAETICAVENKIAEAFPDYDVYRAFTAQIIIDHVARRDNVVIDNVTQALDRCVENGVKTLVVQPTHLMDGLEYNDLLDELAAYADVMDISVGEPLLTSDEDFALVEKAITEATQEYDDGETAIVFMGHGTEAESNEVYAKMQDMLTADGYDHYFVGTVEATPSLDDVIAAVQAGEYKKVVLEPLMVVAGDHANNDMAGDEEGSWKYEFEQLGYEVTPILRGLGSFEDIQAMYVDHLNVLIGSETAAE